MTPSGCAVTELGTIWGNIPVIAATDSAGSQVIIGGHDHSVHYLSPDYKNQKEAEKAGKKVVKKGEVPMTYTNMKSEEGNRRSWDMIGKAFYRKQMRG